MLQLSMRLDVSGPGELELIFFTMPEYIFDTMKIRVWVFICIKKHLTQWDLGLDCHSNIHIQPLDCNINLQRSDTYCKTRVYWSPFNVRLCFPNQLILFAMLSIKQKLPHLLQTKASNQTILPNVPGTEDEQKHQVIHHYHAVLKFKNRAVLAQLCTGTEVIGNGLENAWGRDTALLQVEYYGHTQSHFKIIITRIHKRSERTVSSGGNLMVQYF